MLLFFSPAEENALWDLKVVSDHAPVALTTEGSVLLWLERPSALEVARTEVARTTETFENIPVCLLNECGEWVEEPVWSEHKGN